jgi:hypothetical protein
MSTAAPVAPRRSWLARIWTFVVDLWEVLRRPSSVFGLGMLAQTSEMGRGKNIRRRFPPVVLDGSALHGAGPFIARLSVPRKSQIRPGG